VGLALDLVQVRDASEEDLPAIARIAAANDDTAGADPRYVSHLRTHGRFLVAEAGGEPVGYCGIRRTGEYTMLTDLFVDPERHGGGVGRRLLETALDEPSERLTFASRDPRAMSLYVRFGMVPRWPLLYLSGPPARSRALRTDLVPIADAGAAEFSLTGRDRTPDYAYWGTLPGARGLVVRDGCAVVGAGAVGPDLVHHLVTADGHDPASTLAAALGTFDAGRVRICLPGPHPALPVLLEAGWRIEDLDQHLSSRPGLLSAGSVLSPSLA
jgi:GNAT superfamily N-acetyltransferase